MKTALRIGRAANRRRRGLAPLEFVLALPVLLMIMALMINFGVAARWKVRSLSITREAAWGTRWPRTVGNNPRPAYWPRSAGVDASGPTNVPEIDDPRVNLPVARGPLPQIDVDSDLLDPTRGLHLGSSDIRRQHTMMPRMGSYRIDSYARLLDDKWQYQRMGLSGNRDLRSWRLYNIEMPNVVARMQEANVRVGAAYHQQAPDLYERLTPLDNDLHFLYLQGSSPNFYPRLRRTCTTNREEVDQRVEDLIDRIVGDPSEEPPIDSLARRMRRSFRNLYRNAVQQYQGMPGGELIAAWAQANLDAVESYSPPQ